MGQSRELAACLQMPGSLMGHLRTGELVSPGVREHRPRTRLQSLLLCRCLTFSVPQPGGPRSKVRSSSLCPEPPGLQDRVTGEQQQRPGQGAVLCSEYTRSITLASGQTKHPVSHLSFLPPSFFRAKGVHVRPRLLFKCILNLLIIAYFKSI